MDEIVFHNKGNFSNYRWNALIYADLPTSVCSWSWTILNSLISSLAFYRQCSFSPLVELEFVLLMIRQQYVVCFFFFLQASGVKVDASCKKAYDELHQKHQHSYIIFRISDDDTTIIVDKIGNKNAPYSEFVEVSCIFYKLFINIANSLGTFHILWTVFEDW